MIQKGLCFKIVIVLIIIFSSTVFGADRDQVFLVLWHGLTWDDVAMSPLFSQNVLALGTMNSRVGGGEAVSASYLSIASGSRAMGVNDAGRMLHGFELIHGIAAEDIYQLITGDLISPEIIISPNITSILGAASQAKYPLEVGALANILEDQDVSIAVFGNSDLKDQTVRWAALVGMNEGGRVDQGYVGTDLLISDRNYPHAKRTNYSHLFQLIMEVDADLTIIDLGDPYRYSTSASQFFAEQSEFLRQRMVMESWQFIARLYANAPQSIILIVAPYPGDDRANHGQWLAPVLMIGEGPGLLSSGTTKWSGLISNIDLAPSLINIFKGSAGMMVGRPMRLIASSTAEAMEAINLFEKKIFSLNMHRGLVLRLLVAVQIALYILVLVLLIIPGIFHPKLIRSVHLCLILSLALPLVLLVLPAGWYWALLILAGLALAYYLLENKLKIIMWIALGTAALLTLDVLRGSPWMRFSYLGYDPVGGARYYGIGNEYMGILIGSLIMGWAIARELVGRYKHERYIDLGLFIIIGSVIAAPQWGTNVGGAIAAVCGFGAAWIIAHSKRVTWLKTTVIIGFLVILSLGLLMAFDLNRSLDSRSHIGQTVGLFQHDGLGVINEIIVRKLEMNLKLFRYSIWSRALVIALVAMGASLIWPSYYLQWLLANHRQIVTGIIGTITGTIAALIFNDSGVVAAATCSFFAATTMLALALALKHNLLSSQTNIEQNADRS